MTAIRLNPTAWSGRIRKSNLWIGLWDRGEKKSSGKLRDAFRKADDNRNGAIMLPPAARHTRLEGFADDVEGS